MNESPLCAAIAAQVTEEARLAAALLRRVHAAALTRLPPWDGLPMNALAAHLADAFRGFLAVLEAVRPGLAARIAAPPSMDPRDAADSIDEAARLIAAGFHRIADSDLARRLPTAFVPEGQTVLELLLVNLRHTAAHKYQLFTYLKASGVPVSSRDLYEFRERHSRES
ncbi:MAG: DinB family protein [Bryobacteraceae bacterium]